MRSIRFLIIGALLFLSACGGSEQKSSTIPQPGVSPVITVTVARTAPTANPKVTAIKPTPPASPRSSTPTPTEDSLSITSNPQINKIIRSVSEIRGLKPLAPISLDYMTREQLRAKLEKDINKDYPPSEAEADERVLREFGLISGDLDLHKLYLDLYTEQIGGFYDPETKELYVVSEGNKLNALEELIYAHEVTHALQDQHFHLNPLLKKYEDKDDDAYLAVTSLVEGDARTVEREYLTRYPALIGRIQDEITQSDISSEKLSSAPPIISETLLFPYEAGATFVAVLMREGGLAAVNKAFRDPPTSTEQIIHPERYINRDNPTLVDLPDLSPTLGKGWKKLEENLFGEFQTRVLLDGQIDDLTARKAAAGWDGDEFALWTNGDQEVLVWKSVWDSESDANEFVSAMISYDESRFNARYQRSEDNYILEAHDKTVVISQEGTRVNYVIAPNLDTAQKVLAKLAGDTNVNYIGLGNKMFIPQP